MPSRTPKDKTERRRRNVPLRGEWEEARGPVDKAPGLPRRSKGRGTWSPRTRQAWAAWWSDPVSAMWAGPADREMVLHLADVYEEYVRNPTPSRAVTVRQLLDGLGLSPKGRQDRRWKISDAPEAGARDFSLPGAPHGSDPTLTSNDAPAARRARIHVVDPAAVGE